MTMQNHFALFHLPLQFALDAAQLDAAYREVQNQVHPDKFVSVSDVEKRVAMQWATRANEAYHTLKSPFKRAAYLCELHGVDLQIESNTAMPTAFLMQQMDWREELDDARAVGDIKALAALETAVRATRQTQIAHIATLLDSAQYAAAGEGVRQLMFLEKFGEEVTRVFDTLEA